MDSKGQLDLERLISQSDITIGYSLGRAYGPVVDKIIKQNEGSPKLHPLGHTLFIAILKMIEIDRHFQAAFGYAEEAEYYEKTGEVKEDYTWIPVAGTPPLLLTHMGCPKGPWGKSVIQKFNKIIIENRKTPSALTFMTDWLDETLHTPYQEAATLLYDKLDHETQSETQ